MIRIIEEFIEKPIHKLLIKYTGAISAISGVFLAIQTPTVSEAAKSLAIVQFFWLALLTTALASLFTCFTIFVFQKEKESFPLHGIPVGILSMFIGLLSMLIVLNLLNYTLNIYTEPFSTSVLMGVPVLIIFGAIFFDIFLEKRKHKVPQIILFLANSLIIGVLSGLMALIVQVTVTKMIYPYWAYLTFMITFIGFFLLHLIISIHRRDNPFKPYVPVQ